MTGLLTDLYELRMAAAYLHRGMVGPATFSLFSRKLPAQRGFLVATGLADALEFLAGFEFQPGEVDYLRDEVNLDRQILAALRDMRFTGDVWAVPEGHVVFADEPLLEVTAPIAEAQLVETALLNLITFQTTIASKAVRGRLAAPGAQVADLEKQLDAVTQQRETVFKGETLRGLLLTSYGFSEFGTKAAQAATVAYIGAGVMLLLAVAGFVHAFRTPATRSFGAVE